MYDVIEKINGSTIQHGKYNNRVYLMKLSDVNLTKIIADIMKLAEENKYSKIFAKIPKKLSQEFLDAGYAMEASIPMFYNGEEDAVFLAKYLSEDRIWINEETRYAIDNNIVLAKSKINKGVDKALPEKYSIKQIPESDIDQLSELYKIVFPTYPFPIHDTSYLKEVMKTHVDFFGVYEGKELIAASSAEMDIESKNAEMTDFATNPDNLGQGLALFLLEIMNKYIKNKGFPTAFTIARAMSPGMNITFAKLGYKFSGTLFNNTNISGSIESMNVWYKHL